MARVQLTQLVKRYGETTAVADVTLDIAQGEFMVLLGPSGCGKTTTLRMLAGFVKPTSGNISVGNRDVTFLPPWLRNTGLVFQSYALFPHMTVAENVAFGLQMRRLPKADIAVRVGEALEMVRLGPFAARMPRALSGGQQQRVALARALAIRPDVLLLDEPLSNLDAKLRAEVRVEIRELQQRLGLTTMMVTHDQEEALTMADRLVVMAEGQVRQIGSQRDLYERPANRFVAGFVGRANFMDGTMDAAGHFLSEGGTRIRLGPRGTEAGAVTFSIRPEHVVVTGNPLTSEPHDGFNRLHGTVTVASFLGAVTDIHVLLPTGERMIASVPNRPDVRMPVVGESVELGWPMDSGLILTD